PSVRTATAPVTVLYSGNLGKKQGLEQVVDLAQVLQSERPDIEIVMRGDGNQAEALAAKVSESKLRNVRFLGLVPRETLSDGHAEGDIHIVPQDPSAAAFSLPSKVFSIMAAARPFVTTASAGSPLWRLHERSAAFLCVPP